VRSQLVFAAEGNIPNRYLLVRLAAKAVRRLHRQNSRIEETTNAVLMHFSVANPPRIEEQAVNRGSCSLSDNEI
jgi:hypothetical protein